VVVLTLAHPGWAGLTLIASAQYRLDKQFTSASPEAANIFAVPVAWPKIWYNSYVVVAKEQNILGG